MSRPYQVPLSIELPLIQDLNNFVVGKNTELVKLVTRSPKRFTGVWLHGPAGCGRSHLLRACRRAQPEQVAYLNAADAEFGPQSYSGSHATVMLDDVAAICGNRDQEEAVMGLYQRCLQNDGMLVCVHEEPAAEVDFLLPDLNSRMRSLMHFAMSPLDDEDKAELLKHRAKMRGYELDDRVIHYWLTRGPRDVSRLLVDLDALDRASLSHQKKVTIALLKQVLGY